MGEAKVLDQALEDLRRLDELEHGIKDELFRTAYVAGIFGGFTLFFLTAVLKTFEEVFTSFGVELPPLTAFLVSLSRHLDPVRPVLPVLFLGLLAAIYLFRPTYRRGLGPAALNGILVRLPWAGPPLAAIFLLRYRVAASLLMPDELAGRRLAMLLPPWPESGGRSVQEHSLRGLEARSKALLDPYESAASKQGYVEAFVTPAVQRSLRRLAWLRRALFLAGLTGAFILIVALFIPGGGLGNAVSE